MSPEVSIEPDRLSVRVSRVELVPDVILAKCSNSGRCFPLRCQTRQPGVSVPRESHCLSGHSHYACKSANTDRLAD